jgi:hypothetical protein
MLQAHSFLWHYLWIAPNVLLLVLALLVWKRGLGRQLPAFLAFAVLASAGQLAVYIADIVPWVTPTNFWYVDWASLLIESFVKFVVIGEVFSRVFNSYSSISKLGRFLLSTIGAVLVFLAALAAACSKGDNTSYLISGAHLLEQTAFMIECGVILSLFLFAAYFQLSWDRVAFGVLLGLGISACVHLATWAAMANAEPSAHGRILLDFLNMATYHVCVLIWFYYVLVPQKIAAKSAVPLPDNNLAVWNRELERLLQ